MHGLPAGDVPITLAAGRATLLPEERERVGAELAAAAYAEQRSVTAFEYRILHPSDGVRHIETRSRITYATAGKPTGSIGVAIDVPTSGWPKPDRHLAQHDTLTELPNRSLFQARLEAALMRARRGERFAVCCLDLDHFKTTRLAILLVTRFCAPCRSA